MTNQCWALRCRTQPSFNYEGRKTPMFCRAHAEESMINVINKRCTHAEGCTKRPCFNFKGSQTGVYCRQHAEESMVDVMKKRCTHADGCTNYPSWGYWADGKTSVCTSHKGDLADGLPINFNQQCSVAGVKRCKRRVKWGVDGEQPSHCDMHGAEKATEGLVRVPRGRRASATSSSSRTASASRCATGSEGGIRGEGGVKRARKELRYRAIGSLSGKQGNESDDDDGHVDSSMVTS